MFFLGTFLVFTATAIVKVDNHIARKYMSYKTMAVFPLIALDPDFSQNFGSALHNFADPKRGPRIMLSN